MEIEIGIKLNEYTLAFKILLLAMSLSDSSFAQWDVLTVAQGPKLQGKPAKDIRKQTFELLLYIFKKGRVQYCILLLCLII